MTAFDFSPLFRSTIGFDRLSRLVDLAMHSDEAAGYPPYNIEKVGEDAYRITMAVAGFTADDIAITTQDNQLVVSGKSERGEPEGQFFYRGIAARNFERRFQLADFIKVTGASLVSGLLHIDLVREVPEAMKPRTIKIGTKTPSAQSIASKAA